MSVKISTFSGLEAWLVSCLGHALEPGIFEADSEAHTEPLLAYRIGERTMMRVPTGWRSDIERVSLGLSADELFSILGTYELGRVTLPHGVSVWGPNLYYFGNAETLRPADDQDVVSLSKEEVRRAVDEEVFWHCYWESASANFGVLDDDRLIAMTSVQSLGPPVYEIGVDVAPGSGRRGLGRAVMTAACRWILEQGGLILARTSPWNIPSARLLRSMGLCYTLCDVVGNRGPFRVPPQPLGKPLPNVEIHDHYPMWAQNQEIVRR